jgi:LuxR family transcriptional regulator, maltose regulon positive regulatory protein
MTDSLPHSLISIKIQRPHIGRRLVLRPRLVEQLNPPNNLTFILASAGYGKTTLLSAWLETCRLPTAWLSLDEHDNDLVVFVTGLTEALHSVLPADLDDTLAALSGITLPPPEALARTLLNDLVLQHQDFILVLDDYHVILNRAIHDLMLELVSHLPQTLHLVIASRFDPPFLPAGLRARGYVTELRGGDLCFTPPEVGQFLAETMALTLDEQTISALTATTEGWPAGLRLAALSLRQQRPLAPLTPDSLVNNPYIMDYLVAEVLSQLPLSVQEFLIKCSILNQLCRPLCEAVTGMVNLTFNDQPILEWLERADYFLTAVDDQRHWYRCHQLFRQILRDRLKQHYGPTEIAALQLRASTWFADNGYLDEALHLALDANDMAFAGQLVARQRHTLMNQKQWQRLIRWIQLFPPEVINEQPDLLLATVWMEFIGQRVVDVTAVVDRVESLLSRLPPEVAERLQGEVDARRCAQYYWANDLPRSLTAGASALQHVPPEWWFVRGYTRLFLSAAHQVSGDLAQAYAMFYEADEPDQGRDYQNFLIGNACFVHWVAADLSGVAQAARQVVANSDPSDRGEIITWSRYHLGLYYYQRNDLVAAEEYLQPLVTEPYLLYTLCYLNSAVLLARLRQRQGRPQEAQEIVTTMLSVAHETHSNLLVFSARAFQAELALRQGRLAEASQWAAQYGSFKPAPMPHAFVPPIILAQVLLAQDTPASRQQARQLLVEMNDYFTSIHYTVVIIRVLALQAVLHSAEGDEQQALAELSRSIALAEPGGFIRLFVDLGPALKPLLKKLVQRGVSPQYVADLLAAFDAEDARPGVGHSPRVGADSPRPGSALLTNREQEVLELLAKRYTDKEIAETLYISPGTVRSHIEHLGEKLNVTGRHGIVQAARDQGLLA